MSKNNTFDWLRRFLGGTREPDAFPPGFNPGKRDLIDVAFQQCKPPPRTFAELGGVWGVHGAYARYILDRCRAKGGVEVDTDLTDEFARWSSGRRGFRVVQGNFGDPAVAARVGDVDMVLLFDVLLHQVKPDWDEVLALYAPHTRAFLVFNQQWIAGDETVRLLDLGREEYMKNVPHDENFPPYRQMLEHPDEINPYYGRPWRDLHNIWQWGITDRDLKNAMEKLGFQLVHYRNHGQFAHLANFEDHAFVFEKPSGG